MKLRHSARTDVGKTRDHNEDDFGVGEGAQIETLGHLFVVCDGMGGHAAGEVASRLAVETIIASYYDNSDEDRATVMESAFERANARVHSEGRGSMGTTGVAALLHHDALHIANVGDSRAYLVRDGRIRQLSRDHSLVGDQMAAGLITAEQARSLNYRNVITRALGYQPEVTVDMFRWPLQVGDIVVLSSDGLHTLVTDEEIAQIALEEPSGNAVEKLVDLANERGGTDNITVLIVQVDALDWATENDDSSTRETAEFPAVTLAPPAAATTEQLPVPAAAPAAASSASVSVPGPPEQQPAVAPAAPEAAPSTERRLTLIGGLLATLLLTILVFGVLFSQANTPALPVLTPGIVATNLPGTATPQATATPRASRTTVPTIRPTTAAATPVATTTPSLAPQP